MTQLASEELPYMFMSKRVCVFKGSWSVVSGKPHAPAAIPPEKDPLVPIE